MDKVARLNELLNKKSKLSDLRAKEAASLLGSLYSETEDKDLTAKYLMEFISSVCLYFFENAVRIPAFKTELKSVFDAVCSTDTYKNNHNLAGTTRGFIISAVLIKNKKPLASYVLTETISGIEKNGKFTDAAVKKFKEYVLDYCGSIESIKALGEQMRDDPLSRNRFFKFVQAVEGSIVTVIASNPIEKGTPPDKNIEVSSIPAGDTASEHNNEHAKIVADVFKEAAVLVHSLNEANGTLNLLHRELADRDSRIRELSAELNSKTQIIVEMRKEIDENRQAAVKSGAQITDLTERLKNSLHMDNITKNQELISLKENLKKSLKPEYTDYLTGKESECNQNNYGALLDSLTRIFITLRRFGIAVE